MRALTSVCAIARVPTRRPEPDLLDRLLVTSGHTSSEPGDDPALGANGGDKIRGIRRAEAYRRRDDLHRWRMRGPDESDGGSGFQVGAVLSGDADGTLELVPVTS